MGLGITSFEEGEIDDEVIDSKRPIQRPINQTLIDANRSVLQESWIKGCKFSCKASTDRYISVETTEKVGSILKDFAETNGISFGTILEVMAGSGIVATDLKLQLEGLFDRWICTDMHKVSEIVEEMDCIKAVKAYGDEVSTLLLINPPPNPYDETGEGLDCIYVGIRGLFCL